MGGWLGTFNGFTSIDRQTVLNDDDGSLTGLAGTIVVNNDPFFVAPVEGPECLSGTAGPLTFTARTSPYEYVTTAVYPGCAVDQTSADAAEANCAAQDWARDWSVKPVRAALKGTVLHLDEIPHFAGFDVGKDGAGFLTVTLDLHNWQTQFDQAREDSCRPGGFCSWDSGTCQCASKSTVVDGITVEPLATSNPALYQECVKGNICGWAVRQVDCPKGGCIGFKFTLNDEVAGTQKKPAGWPKGSRTIPTTPRTGTRPSSRRRRTWRGPASRT